MRAGDLAGAAEGRARDTRSVKGLHPCRYAGLGERYAAVGPRSVPVPGAE
jgi:hypothetical protein